MHEVAYAKNDTCICNLSQIGRLMYGYGLSEGMAAEGYESNLAGDVGRSEGVEVGVYMLRFLFPCPVSTPKPSKVAIF